MRFAPVIDAMWTDEQPAPVARDDTHDAKCGPALKPESPQQVTVPENVLKVSEQQLSEATS